MLKTFHSGVFRLGGGDPHLTLDFSLPQPSPRCRQMYTPQSAVKALSAAADLYFAGSRPSPGYASAPPPVEPACRRRWVRQASRARGKPAIGGTEQNGSRLLLAWFVVVTAQVWMATITSWKIFHCISAEGIGHTPLLTTGFAYYLDIGSLARDAKLNNFSLAWHGTSPCTK